MKNTEPMIDFTFDSKGNMHDQIMKLFLRMKQENKERFLVQMDLDVVNWMWGASDALDFLNGTTDEVDLMTE